MIVAAVLVLTALAVLVTRWRDGQNAPHGITPPAKRILFPFVGATVSTPALDAALRLARAEQATLVPAYIATVPLQLNLDIPIPDMCEAAVPLLEVIEMRAARMGVPVDARIETGRSARHALRRLAENVSFDRLVIPASDSSDGFSADDIAWLLEHIDGEIIVLRPARSEDHRRHQPAGEGGTPGARVLQPSRSP